MCVYSCARGNVTTHLPTLTSFLLRVQLEKEKNNFKSIFNRQTRQVISICINPSVCCCIGHLSNKAVDETCSVTVPVVRKNLCDSGADDGQVMKLRTLTEESYRYR